MITLARTQTPAPRPFDAAGLLAALSPRERTALVAAALAAETLELAALAADDGVPQVIPLAHHARDRWRGYADDHRTQLGDVAAVAAGIEAR